MAGTVATRPAEARMRMIRRAVIVGIAVAGTLGTVLVAQTPRATSGVVAAAWVPPVTPWGEPDLQGSYTNKYEYGTPFERPPEFAGRRPEEVTPRELAEVM